MKSIVNYILISILLISVSQSQNHHTIMSYNLLNYPGSDAATRNQYFRTIVSNIQPDILVVQEITSQAGVDGFLNNVLNNSGSSYSAGTFINGTTDTENAIFYKNTLFTFISNVPIKTALRDINEFKLVYNLTNDTVRIYSLHLKASDTSDDRLKRAAEVDSLRKRTNTLQPGSNYLVVGDYNIYGSTESAYQKLLNQNGQGYFLDLYTLSGSWNQSQYSAYHTQSPRIRQFGGGSTGGMDDRFDMMLMSQAIIDEGDITYIPGSFKAFGNDGDHYNDSINKPPNTAVSQVIANALHNASDHLPIIANFTFESSFVELASFKALIEGLYNGTTMMPDTVTVELRTVSSPFTLVDQTKVALDNTGTGSGKFFNAVNGVPYYLVLKYRNSIETWSASTQTFSSGILSYDFTTGSSKAYGNNLKQVNGKWCVYSGDVNQDGFINIQDLSLIYTDNINGVTGNTATDLNGDLFTESDDLIKVFVNKVLGIVRKKPQ